MRGEGLKMRKENKKMREGDKKMREGIKKLLNKRDKDKNKEEKMLKPRESIETDIEEPGSIDFGIIHWMTFNILKISVTTLSKIGKVSRRLSKKISKRLKTKQLIYFNLYLSAQLPFGIDLWLLDGS